MMPTNAAAAASPTLTKRTVKRILVGAPTTLLGQTIALRAVRHARAARVAQQADLLSLAAKALIALHDEMDQEARAIAGEDYADCHSLAYERHGSMNDQLNSLGEILAPGLIDIVGMAHEMGMEARAIATEAVPPPLPSEA
jgi:hypothetical protein